MVDIVTFTPNPAIDFATSVERVTPVHKLRCHDAKRDPGGGGINVARVLRRWERDVLAIYPSGGPTGELLERLVRREGVPCRVVPVASDTRENFMVFERSTRNEFRFVFPGEPLSETEWRACCDAVATVKPAPRYVVASGSLPPGTPADAYARIIRAAKSIGAQTAIDTFGAPLKCALDEGVYIAKPSLRELTELIGKSLEGLPAQTGACRDLVQAGKAEIVALTLGDRGALAVTRTGAWWASAPAIQTLSAVGAGDSFLAVMLWRLAAGDTVAEALRNGVAAGSAALLTPGTELARRADAEHLLPQVLVKEIES